MKIKKSFPPSDAWDEEFVTKARSKFRNVHERMFSDLSGIEIEGTKYRLLSASID